MFLVAYPDSAGAADGADAAATDDSVVARAVAGAAALIAEDPEAARPTPGSVIPDAVRVGLDAGQDSEPNAGQGSTVGQEAAEAESGFAASGSTTPHLLCVVPYVWPDGVPTITEEPGKISLHEDEGTAGFPDAVTGGARLTTVTQLVPITDAEYAHANERGVDSLMQMLAAADADLRDLRRASVVA
nr:suppressor of fused domain protein [Corynebacterium xerosis]